MADIPQEIIDKLNDAVELVINSYTFHPVKEELFVESASNTNETINMDTILAGRLYFITSVSAVDEDNSPTNIKLGIYDGTQDHWHKIKTSPIAGETVSYVGMLVLDEGKRIRATYTGVTSGDRLALYINGYWIEV